MPCNNADFDADSGSWDLTPITCWFECEIVAMWPTSRIRVGRPTGESSTTRTFWPTRRDQPGRRATGPIQHNLKTVLRGAAYILRSIRPPGDGSIQLPHRLPARAGSVLRWGALGAGDPEVALRSRS
jgi:hypothetical protein